MLAHNVSCGLLVSEPHPRTQGSGSETSGLLLSQFLLLSHAVPVHNVSCGLLVSEPHPRMQGSGFKTSGLLLSQFLLLSL